ncbi:MAG: hypothetical protein M5U09_07115 [Gammaproteobacteria bacterium]|nr:hypothetical protein [Gammaproteobacteria bacterium]
MVYNNLNPEKALIWRIMHRLNPALGFWDNRLQLRQAVVLFWSETCGKKTSAMKT